MKTEYVLAATKPNGDTVFWTHIGFSQSIERAARLISIDFAALTGKMEQDAHPDWNVMIRIYERDEFIDECGPLPTCQFCHLEVGVCECPKSAAAANQEASGYPYF